MAWDSSRPIPWARLSKEWLVYAGLISIVFLLFFRDSLSPGSGVGLLASYPMYLALGAVLAKFGYQRATLKQVREQRQTAPEPTRSTTTPSSSGGRRPPPTKRTSTGRSQHPRRTRSSRKR